MTASNVGVPLEWTDTGYGLKAIAFAPNTPYRIHHEQDEGWYCSGLDSPDGFDTMAQAKAAAQAHYDARALSPLAPAEGLRQAAELADRIWADLDAARRQTKLTDVWAMAAEDAGWKILSFAAKLAPKPAEGEAVPVAWHWWAKDAMSTWPVWSIGAERPARAPVTAIPLYAAPVAPTVTEAMVERAARSLAVSDGKNPDAMSHNSFQWWRHYVPQARAALAAAFPIGGIA